MEVSDAQISEGGERKKNLVRDRRAARWRFYFELFLEQIRCSNGHTEEAAGECPRVNHEHRRGGSRAGSDEYHLHECSPRSAQASVPQPGGRRRQDDQGPMPLRPRRYRHLGRPLLRRRRRRPRPRLQRRRRGGVDVRGLRERSRRCDRAPHRAPQAPPRSPQGRGAEAAAGSVSPLLQRLRPRATQEQRVQAHAAPVARRVRRRGPAHPQVHPRRRGRGLRAVPAGR